MLPINYSGLALIGLGLALLISELFLPSFGVLGVGGIVAFVLGSLLLFDTPDSDLTVDREHRLRGGGNLRRLHAAGELSGGADAAPQAGARAARG